MPRRRPAPPPPRPCHSLRTLARAAFGIGLRKLVGVKPHVALLLRWGVCAIASTGGLAERQHQQQEAQHRLMHRSG